MTNDHQGDLSEKEHLELTQNIEPDSFDSTSKIPPRHLPHRSTARVHYVDSEVTPSEESHYPDSYFSKLRAFSSRRLNFSNLQLRGFREIFSVIDREDTGEFGAEDIFTCIQEHFPDSNLTKDVAEMIMEDINITETGKVTFDEFLFALSQPNELLELVPADVQTHLGEKLLTWERLSGKRFKDLFPRRQFFPEPSSQKVFFQLVKEIAAKHLHKDIQQYYVSAMTQIKDDTLLHWTAGKRVEGLSLYQIMDKYEELKEVAKSMATIHNWDSPYAQPLIVDFRKTIEAEEKYNREMRAFIIRAHNAGIYRKRQKKRIRSKKPAREAEEAEIEFKDAEEDMGKEKCLRKVKSAPVNSTPRIQLKKRCCQSAKPVLTKHVIPRLKYSQFIPSTSVVALPRFPIPPGTHVSYKRVDEIKEVATEMKKRYYRRISSVAMQEAHKYYGGMHPEQMNPRLRKLFQVAYWTYCGSSTPHNSFYVPFTKRQPHPDGVYINGLRWK